MDFSLNEIQSMLGESIDRYLANDYSFETRQRYAGSDRGFSTDAWRRFVDLGWTVVPFAEADGGFDGDAVDVMVVMERFGRGLVVEPWLPNLLLAGGMLKRLGDETQRARWLHPVIGGERQAALAFAEPQGRYDLANQRTRARRDGDDWLLDGEKTYVLNGRNADSVIVTARTAGDETAPQGIAAFVVDAGTPGLEVRGYPTVDGLQAADISLDGVRVPSAHLLGDAEQAVPALADTVDDATLAVCAEAVGILQVLVDRTVEYSKNRVQFGVPIGSFQALQHRMVDMLTGLEQSRSLLWWATMSHAEGGAEAKRAVSAIKYMIGTTGRKIGEEAVQLHGGMGVTWELDVAHYFKRLVAIGQVFGNADWHLDRLAG